MMSEDLLTRIKRETHERLQELLAAIDESDRLRAELRALEAEPEQSTNVIRLPANRQLPHRPMVSPKVLQLMRSRQSLSIERAGAVPRRSAA